MIHLKSARELERMRVAGRFVAEVLERLRAEVAVGVNLLDLEQLTRQLIKDRGAVSCYWDYAPSFGSGPFRNVICLSVNDAVLHGKPHDHRLADGDLLTLDLAVTVDGWAGDAAISVIAGTPAPEDERLIKATEEALAAGIAAAQVDHRLGDVSAAITEVGRRYGYPINDQFGGHGIGRRMHEDPHVSNVGRPGRGLRLRPGLTFSIEPWFAHTTDKISYDPDGWTLRSADGSRTAHSEHTIAVTEDGPVILTQA